MNLAVMFFRGSMGDGSSELAAALFAVNPSRRPN